MTSKSQKLILFINHNIFLTREQRYDLVNRNSIEVVGVSMPVWTDEYGKSTEPAEEIFCKYRINNDKGKRATVKALQDNDKNPIGYWINLPQLPNNWKPVQELNLDYVAKITSEERIKIMDLRDVWLSNNSAPLNGTFLLDPQDKGAGRLRFEIKMNGKLEFNSHEKSKVLISHLVDIKTIDSLKESLT